MAEAVPFTSQGALSQDAIDATLKLAFAQHQRGELALADALYAQVLLLDPDNGDALHLKGLVALATGATTEAAALLDHACRVAPRSPLFQRNRGEALAALGRWSDAVVAFKRAVALKPDWADAHASLGTALAATGDSAGAKTAFRAATHLDPTLAAAWINLGVLHLAAKDADDAVSAFSTAVAVLTRDIKTGAMLSQALNGLGVAQTESGRLDEALGTFAQALAGFSTGTRGSAEVLANRAVALQKLERWSEALDDLRAASAIAPEHGPLWRTMSKSLVALGAIGEAEAACTRALALDPHDASARYERSFVRLLAGDFAGGFDDYRHRPTVDRARAPLPAAPLPVDLTGRRFRLLLEQGLGEHLFFLRYAPMLAARGASLAIETDPKLLAILERALPGNPVRRETATPGFEPVYLGDLPYLTGVRAAPPSLALTPDPALCAEMAARLAAFGPPPYVALTWRAGIQDGKSLSKVVPFEAYAAVMKRCSATLISIQRAPLAGETERLSSLIGKPILDLSAINDDLARMLALHSLLADYVGVSNTNMHLRAALALPAHPLVPHPPEFRWMARGERSPWFPTFVVYRAAPTWDESLARLGEDLGRG